MAKEKVFNITKDFSHKELERVFVLEHKSDEYTSKDVCPRELCSLEPCSLEPCSLEHKIINTLEQSQVVYLVAETALSEKLIKILYTSRKESGIRIYIITKDLQNKEIALGMLKNNCIIREVPHISGNFLLCDTTKAFFFDDKLHGYSVEKPSKVQKLRDLFIYEFWYNSTKELVDSITDRAEQTFDVAPVMGNEDILIDCSALENKPYPDCLDKSNTFVLSKKYTPWIEQQLDKKKNLTLYLDKEVWNSQKENLMKKDGCNLIYTENNAIPLCKYGENWFLLNNNFHENMDNTGRLFAVKMEQEPSFSDQYRFHPVFSYGDAVGKSMFSGKTLEPVEITEEDIEERSISYSLKEFKKIVKMKEEERVAYFDKIHLLLSDKLASKIEFQIKMTIKKLSKGATPAPIYHEYEVFLKDFAAVQKEITSKLDDCKSKKNKFEKDLDTLKNQIADFNQKRDENEAIKQHIQSLGKKIKELEAQISSAQADDVEKGQGLLKKAMEENCKSSNVEELKKELKKLQQQKKDLEKKVVNFQEQEQKSVKLFEQQEEIQQKLQSVEENVKDFEKLQVRWIELKKLPKTTVADCKKIKEELSQFNQFKFELPAFDKPQYGTLYKVKSDYEYAVNSEDNMEAAEKEMEGAGIENVEIVCAS